MKKIIYIRAAVFCAALSAQLVAVAQGPFNGSVSVASPNGKVVAVVSVDEPKGSISYKVSKDGRLLVSESALGLAAKEVDFTEGLGYVSQSARKIDEYYAMPMGKSTERRNECNELTLNFLKDSKTFSVVFRAYDDGVAYRYKVDGDGELDIVSDASEIILPQLKRCWGQKYSDDYSVKYPMREWDEVSSIEGGAMCVPVLVDNGGNEDWCLVAGAGNNGNFCVPRLKPGGENENGVFRFALDGEVKALLPLATPWKALLVGSVPDIVESSLVENLNDPTSISDFGWIAPGLSSWDWGGQDGSSVTDFEIIKTYIDLAYQMHWPYFTLDEGWARASYRLKDVVDYAASKGVKVFIWSHQNRFSNDEGDIRDILSNWRDLGFVGIKVDFFCSDSQQMMQKYDKILRVAADLHMMVNFHGCTAPSGLSRTWPNLITSEAVYGGEQYYFNHLATPANHNVTLAMTRGAVGPMDYTPVEFARHDGVIRHTTTWSHQLALAVIYESGMQTMSDSPENYLYNPSRELLSQLPGAWDETRCVEAAPDEYVTMLRRSGDDWYAASISPGQRTLSLPLSFLGDGDYVAQIWKDGICPSDIAYEERIVDASSTLGLDVKATGGVTVRLSRKGLAQPSYDVYEAEDGVLGGSATMDNDSKGNCSGGKMVGFIGRGGTVTLNGVKAEKSGVYDMTLFYVSNEERETYYCVNGGEKHYVSFPKNNVSWDSEGLAIKTVQVELSEGDNSIEFGNDRNYGVNIDRIMVSPSRKCAKVSIESMPNFADGAVLSDDEPVKMKIRNNSPSDITGVKVSYVLTSGSGPEQSAVQDVLGIAGGATVDVTFDRSLDLSAVASYNLQISILDDADNNIVGDMKSVTFSRVPEQDGTSISLASNGGKIHSFSSQTGDSESAAKLIDNDLSTKWCDNNSSKPWVILELPDLYEVDKFVMWDCKTKEENYRNIDQYVVSVSTESPDKGEWTEVTNTKNRKCENVKVDEFASQKARYVKLEARRPDDDNAVRVYGFDVYGTLCTGVEGVVKSDDTLSFVSGALHCTGEKPCAVRVYGIDGKAVMSFVIEAGETMKLDLPKGVYTVVTSFGQAMKVMF